MCHLSLCSWLFPLYIYIYAYQSSNSSACISFLFVAVAFLDFNLLLLIVGCLLPIKEYPPIVEEFGQNRERIVSYLSLHV